MNTVYLVRHSEPLKIPNYKGDSILLSNMKYPLSVDGEHLAEKIANNNEFDNLDIVWSSNYVRTISTAKYFANKNNIELNISEDLGERKHGINSWDELPVNFEVHQFEDENYKLVDGESQKEVRERLTNVLYKILDENNNKRILIVGHSTATAFLLKNWCEVNYTGNYKFKGEVFFDGNWKYCETFKLVFDDNKNLISINNIFLGS